MPSSTLIKPPAIDTSKSPIENILELLPLRDIGPDIYTNIRPLWHPPGARGIYGGAAIAQCLAAAQLTIPPPTSANNNAVFLVHSMHCYFVLAGDASIPVLYHVERVREGKSFMTRTVQARQRGKCIFTVTMSFVREGSAGKKTVHHECQMPEGVRAQLEADEEDDKESLVELENVSKERAANGEDSGAFLSRRIGILNNDSPHPHLKRTRQWIRARGHISPSSGHEPHLSALAYMTDSNFIGTVSRVQNLWRFGRPPSKNAPPPTPRASAEASSNNQTSDPPSSPSRSSHPIAEVEAIENAAHPTAPVIGMMVSLDHTIYFHRPRDFRADEWLFSEMESPWAGDGRGVVFQRIWSRGGELVATCVQEGLVRLVQDEQGVREEGEADSEGRKRRRGSRL
ncbi:hypothetical protein MMC13_004769 [Lambiella insularis]|nr:hypothetical protein [Lambiella insularis]